MLTLMPILAKEHIEMAPPEPLEIHRLIEGGDVSTLRKRIDALREQAFFLRPVEKLRETIHKAKKMSSEEDKPSGSATT